MEEEAEEDKEEHSTASCIVLNLQPALMLVVHCFPSNLLGVKRGLISYNWLHYRHGLTVL